MDQQQFRTGLKGLWIPSTNLKRLKHTGELEPAIMAVWLRDEVALNPQDVPLPSGHIPLGHYTQIDARN